MSFDNYNSDSQRSPLRVLIVGDSRDAAELFHWLSSNCPPSKTLSPLFSNLVSTLCITGAEALEHCRHSMPDCILVDQDLADEESLALVHRIQSLEVAQVPAIILLRNHSPGDTVGDAIRLGIADIIYKGNLTPQRLEWTLLSALERSHLRQQLIEKQDAFETFASQAAHDMISPLTNLSLIVEYMQDRLDEESNAELAETFDSMSLIIDYMASMIDGLRNYAYMGRDYNAFSLVDLQEIYDYIELIFDYEIGEAGVRLHAEPLPTVVGDKVGMSQLLQNLIGNAIKYSNEDAPEIVVRAEKMETEWHLSVSDNGIGIDPMDYGKIFEPFKRLHSRAIYPGSGLGLSTCKKVVEQHGGQIWVESETGKGSTFHVTLPESLPKELFTMSANPNIDATIPHAHNYRTSSSDWDVLLEVEVPVKQPS